MTGPSPSWRPVCDGVGDGPVASAGVDSERHDLGDRARAGLVHLYTGDGKGKTTAAVGLAVRAAGRGRRVWLVQFLKGRFSGEVAGLARLPTVTTLRLSRDFGFYRDMSPEQRQAVRQEHDQLLARAAAALAAGDCQLLILDEIAAAWRHSLVAPDQVLSLLDDRPDEVEVVLTGREAPDELTRRADYITVMTKVRHPFDHGLPAREGVEW
ncbi:MAG: cob(I)yrinic acid a,c-diamide adenosyltransferase [Propionibacteriaceae bacterium]|jgi:cob(I)alamin adenosyltransferase|nr:cob(I)yrinic acid a,c-diamide adenosyltransferase [Propionibacteriaceae bacterium]